MAAREAAAPPRVDGFTPVRLIGAGGYADVFLYEQQMPVRQVAIKVLVADVLANDVQRRQFSAEANLMARVSSHPYIVSVFQAAIAPDGRPYIVMEYYPGSNYLERVRREQFSVAEVLRTGIHIASAVETAHRAGIIHRDIKPANILTSEYGRPGLTDFGIASPDDNSAGEVDGISVPWAPPEAFGADRLDERSDVYSLAASLFHLLAARSPFDQASGNSPLELMSRIEHDPVRPTGHADVPASLERVLAQAMSKRPEHRPDGAAEFGRLLQGVEAELHLAVTQLELAGESRPTSRLVEDLDANDDSKRVRGITSIRAQEELSLDLDSPRSVQSAPISAVPVAPVGFQPVPERRHEGLLAEPELESTIHRELTTAPSTADSVSSRAPSNRLKIVVAAAALLVLVLVGIGIIASRGGDDGESADGDVLVNDGEVEGTIVIQLAPDVVSDLSGVQSGDTYSFTWQPPSGAPTDLRYQVTEQETADKPRTPFPPQELNTFTSAVPCIEVVAISGNLASPAMPACASDVATPTVAGP